MEQETQTPHKRRVRYKGKYPRKFEEKYKAELRNSPEFGQFLKTVESHPVVTFVYASRDVVHNEAAVLQTICREV